MRRIIDYLRDSDIDWAENREEYYEERKNKIYGVQDTGILWRLGVFLSKLNPFVDWRDQREVERSVKLKRMWRAEREILERIQELSEKYQKVSAKNRELQTYEIEVEEFEPEEFLEEEVGRRKIDDLEEFLDDAEEEMAELEHKQWRYWVGWIMDEWGDELPEELVEKWKKNDIPYDELSEEQKDKDRTWSEKTKNKLLEEAGF